MSNRKDWVFPIKTIRIFDEYFSCMTCQYFIEIVYYVSIGKPDTDK